MIRQITILNLLFTFLFPASYTPTVDHWETAIYNTDIWKYFTGISEPPAGCSELTFNDFSVTLNISIQMQGFYLARVEFLRGEFITRKLIIR